MRIAIHQPNFFPWLGFFHKLFLSDGFVFLDHVRANPDQNWMKRVRIKNQGQAVWLSLPTKHTKGKDEFPRICDLAIDVSKPFYKKHLRVIEHNYSQAPHFASIYPIVEEYYRLESSNLVERNLFFISTVCKKLAVAPKLFRSSDLKSTGSATDLLISIVKEVQGTSYLCGGGAAGYQEDRKFDLAGLKLEYQNFTSKAYYQGDKGEFIEGLSTIDALMYCGFDGVKALLDKELR